MRRTLASILVATLVLSAPGFGGDKTLAQAVASYKKN